jgi:hypothetical protein
MVVNGFQERRGMPRDEWFDKISGTQVVRRIVVARYRHQYEERSLSDAGRDLVVPNCPACASEIDFDEVRDQDVVGGKHFAYRTRACLWCGWWQMHKFREDPRTNEIYWCQVLSPQTTMVPLRTTFCFDDKRPDVAYLMRHLIQHASDLNYISWQAFEDLVGQYLLDYGVAVKDVSRVKNSFGDFLWLDTADHTTIVEVKHHHAPIGTDVALKLLAVLGLNKEIDRGMIVSTARLTSDALTLVEHGSIPPHPITDGSSRLEYIRREQICAWLQDCHARQVRDLLSTVMGVISDDAMMEM